MPEITGRLDGIRYLCFGSAEGARIAGLGTLLHTLFWRFGEAGWKINRDAAELQALIDGRWREKIVSFQEFRPTGTSADAKLLELHKYSLSASAPKHEAAIKALDAVEPALQRERMKLGLFTFEQLVERRDRISLIEHPAVCDEDLDGFLAACKSERPYSTRHSIYPWKYSFLYDRYQWNYEKKDRGFSLNELRLRCEGVLDSRARDLKRLAGIDKAKSLPLFERRSQIPEDVRALVFRRDGGKCVDCKAESNLQFDHVVPFSEGGGDQAENLVIRCATCNQKKSGKI